MTQPRYVRVVSFWIHPGQEAAFEAFERGAARIMERHGGRIDSAVRVAPGREADAPFEVHIVSFPNRTMAESYAADPETAGLMARRPEIFARTDVIEGTEAGPYRC
jgi:antibiotic biosynthesis monooxygenase (ABM) superfamily enzyme